MPGPSTTNKTTPKPEADAEEWDCGCGQPVHMLVSVHVFGSGLQEKCRRVGAVDKRTPRTPWAVQWAISAADRNAGSKILLWKFQRERRNWARGHLCYILANHLAASRLCLHETEFKSNELIYWAEEISKQPSIQALSRVEIHEVEWEDAKVCVL